MFFFLNIRYKKYITEVRHTKFWPKILVSIVMSTLISKERYLKQSEQNLYELSKHLDRFQYNLVSIE